MGAFKTAMNVGDIAYVVRGTIDPYIEEMRVGQIRITQTHPSKALEGDWHLPVYREEYMCFETGVGSGTVWTLGKHIFANEKDALAGMAAVRQHYHAERAARDARAAERAAEAKAADLAELNRLKAKYEQDLS